MNTFPTVNGAALGINSSLEQLKTEHLLQRDRDLWQVIPTWPYLAIDTDRLFVRLPSLVEFPVFSSGQLWQNFRQQDLSERLLGALIGGGTDAGMGVNSRAFVEGKANAKANVLINWNAPFIVGSTPWCAEGTHFIYVEGENLFQHKFGVLTTVNEKSRPSSENFDFTNIADLRDQFNRDYLNGPRDGSEDLNALAVLLDRTFEQNALSLYAAATYHSGRRAGLSSVDYEAPVLTKYDRTTHDASGQPKIEVSFALLHYEKALVEFNAMKKSREAGKMDAAFSQGVYCTVAVAACLEAIANGLVYAQTSHHPDHKDKRPPLKKINEAASALAARERGTYTPLLAGHPTYDVLDHVRVLRNSFMHAKELETDIDPDALTSTVLTSVGESECRKYLTELRTAVAHVFAQLPSQRSPIVTGTNVQWLGDLEVP
ncbi:hypothetical protein ACOTCN_23715 [Achromobacter xylosoxidans]